MKMPSSDWIKRQGVRAGVGVLGALALALFILGPRGLAHLRLAIFISRLPESVVLIRHVPAHKSSDRLWTLAERLFSLRSAPSEWSDETSSLLLYVRKGESLVPLRLASSSSEPSGTSWSRAALSGDMETIAATRHSLRRIPSLRDIRLALRLLKEQQHFVLFRPSFLAAVHPVFAGGSTTSWDAMTWTSDRQEVRFRIFHVVDGHVLNGTHLQLPSFVLPPLLALDGFRLEQVVPVDLPPTLHVLREATGVADELKQFQERFAEQPVAFLLAEERDRLQPILVIALKPGEAGAFREHITALFRARLRLLHAEAERVQTSDGRTIRHRRPPADVPLREETQEGGSVLLRAPCAGVRELSVQLQRACREDDSGEPGGEERPQDLVALIGPDRAVIGLGERSVRNVFGAVRDSSLASVGRGTVTAVADIDRLRHIPLLEGILGASGSGTSPWWTVIRRISLTAERTLGGIVTDGSLSLSPVPDGTASGTDSAPK